MIFIVVLILGYVVMFTLYVAPVAAHRSTGPSRSTSGMNDVVGIHAVKEEVIRSINLFLAHKTFAAEMGGTPRRGLLFEGAPGTGKTHTAKAMAAEAGVPFLFVSGDVVPVDVLRRDRRQDPLVLQGAAQDRSR